MNMKKIVAALLACACAFSISVTSFAYDRSIIDPVSYTHLPSFCLNNLSNDDELFKLLSDENLRLIRLIKRLKDDRSLLFNHALERPLLTRNKHNRQLAAFNIWLPVHKRQIAAVDTRLHACLLYTSS